MSKPWEVLVRDIEGKYADCSIPCFSTIEEARAWVEGQSLWLAQNNYIVEGFTVKADERADSWKLL